MKKKIKKEDEEGEIRENKRTVSLCVDFESFFFFFFCERCVSVLWRVSWGSFFCFSGTCGMPLRICVPEESKEEKSEPSVETFCFWKKGEIQALSLLDSNHEEREMLSISACLFSFIRNISESQTPNSGHGLALRLFVFVCWEYVFF